MKKIIWLFLLVLVLVGCTQVSNPPDIDGVWAVEASVSGSHKIFEIHAVVEGMYFTDLNGEVEDGALSNSNMIRFVRDGYYFYGNVEADTMDGFIRKGISGDIVGYWNAKRKGV